MPLLNYTTTVAATKTVGQIQQILATGKARQIVTQYDEEGRPSGVGFTMTTPFGPRSFALPVHPDRVLHVLKRDRNVPQRYKTPEQAERVAWRILKDWLEAQLAIVATEMVAFDQVMLPYMTTDESGTTVYENYVLSGRNAELEAPADDAEVTP